MSLSSTASLVKTSRNTPTESKQIIESTIWVGSVLEAILMIASLELLRCSTPSQCLLRSSWTTTQPEERSHIRSPPSEGVIESSKKSSPTLKWQRVYLFLFCHVLFLSAEESLLLRLNIADLILHPKCPRESYHPLINYLKIQKDLTAGFSTMPDDPAKENLRRCFSDPSLQTSS
ncbi:hypothetical protein PGT21_015312 [Puccinia graminis f. sp. tritici]|uniref:Uncharacterized protein n=1 Tax=Puccinia graminis f. sp. tritici TaxID=56615 RepID=A0A5B0LMY5_PUCGR|nr:hypothetical protein PGTUg99_019635 [Puccinia graminis f. sp. tritici]KAA1090841.1 hypothetical protein PGT21_015312 [Puccinia graminis f. sp. tritici]